MAKLYSVGGGFYEGLGNGSADDITTVTQAGVVDTWESISAGESGSGCCTLLIKADGTLWVFGENSPRLGLGSATPGEKLSPVQIGSDSTWAQVAVGTYSCFAIKDNGTLWAWGENAYGECGTGSVSVITSPTQIGSSTQWAKVWCGNGFTAAIKTDGTLWTCGRNNTGQLARGSPGINSYTLTQVGSATDWVGAHLGDTTLMVINSSGVVYGSGSKIQIGTGTSSGQVSTLTATTAVETYTALGGGALHTLLIGASGKLYATGDGYKGVLGQGSTTTYASPTQVGSGTDWTAVASGNGYSSVAKNSSGVMAWGNNPYRQTGATSATDPLTTPTATSWPADTSVAGVRFAVVSSAFLEVTAPPAEPEEGDIEATVTIEVQNAGTISAPITIAVTSSGDISAPIWINVYDPEIFGETLAPTSTTEGDPVPAFSALVTLGGADVSADLIGRIEVDAEESAARIATFTLALSGEIDPSDWVGAAVTVDYKIGTTTWRLFTGSVDLPQIDIQAGTVLMRCTDGLQRIIDRSDKEQIDTLSSGAVHSRIVFGTRSNRGWRYITERLRTLAGHIDLSPHGAIRKTLWAISGSQKTFTDDDVLDESVSLSLSPATSLVRRVKAYFQARVPILRTATMLMDWSAPVDAEYYPAIQTVRDAFDKIDNGWLAKTLFIRGNSQEQTADYCSASLIRRFVQDVTSDYEFTIAAGPLGNGKEQTLRSSLVARYDEAAWEQDGESIIIDPVLSGSSVDDDVEEAINALRALARRSILDSHRGNRVEFDILLDPTIDIIHTYTLDAQRITCTGKCRRVQHVIDMDAGEATSSIVLALSLNTFGDGPGYIDDAGSYAMVDTPRPVIVLDAPANHTQVTIWPVGGGSTEPDWDLDGWACLVAKRFVGETRTPLTELSLGYGKIRDMQGRILDYRVDVTYRYDIQRAQFKISTPAVPDEYLEAITESHASGYNITVPEDPLTITI